MQPLRPLRFLFVLNPVSGGKSKGDFKEAITDYFQPKEIPIGLHFLTGKNDADCLDERIKEFLPDRVIAVGGDGTVNLVARKLLQTNISMGILPAGSANGLAKELQLPLDPQAALEVIENGDVEKMDVLRINQDVISLHLADLGLNAQLIKYFEEDNWRGKLGYAKVLAKTLWRKQKVKVIIETEDGRILRKAYMVVLANSRTYGTGAVINPHGDLGDGKFEVVIVRKLAISELLKMILHHKEYDSNKVEVLHTKKVQISANRPIYFQSDGEYLGKKNCVEAEIIPQALSIVKQKKGNHKD